MPEQFRKDHIKAITAIQHANVDLHMNLKTELPDGRIVRTYIRPGRGPGRGKLLTLVKHLPWNFNTDNYRPLSRAQVFTSEDGRLSISIFVFGEDKEFPCVLTAEVSGARILDFAKHVQNGDFSDDDRVPSPSPLFERDSIVEYLTKCPESYIVRADPRRFLQQMSLYNTVSADSTHAIVA